MSHESSNSIGSLALYPAAAIALWFSITGAPSSSGAWLGFVLLVPMMALLLPPVRHLLDPRQRYMPEPMVSICIAAGLLWGQYALYNLETKRIEAVAQAELVRQAQEAAEKAKREAEEAKRALLDELARDKAKVVERVEGLLAKGLSDDALAAVNKYLAVSDDPDLLRLKRRAEVVGLKRELQQEYRMTLERREEVYRTLLQEEPGSASQYRKKLAEVVAARQKEEQLKARAAERAAFEARIKNQFSAWDGSHRNVEAAIKARMHNPRSYEHVETRYRVNDGTITIFTTYRGTNAFGAVVTNSSIALVDASGRVLTLD